MKINTQKFKAFFGLSPEATDAELDRKVDEELKAREHATATDQGEDAGADGASEADAATSDNNDASQQSTTTATEDAPAAGVTMEQLQAAISEAVTAATAPLVERLAAIEAQDADEPTGGKPEPAKVTDSEQPVYASNPINQRVAQALGKK